MRDLKHLREPLSLRDDLVGFGTIGLLLLALWLSSCQTVCPVPPVNLPEVERTRVALVQLYDWNDDGCVTEEHDTPALDALFKARGGNAFNAYRVVLGQCK